MSRFNHLNVPSEWQNYWTKSPQGYTMLEALLNWVAHVDNLTDNINNWNDYLDDFVKTYDRNVQGTITDILSEWQESGFLDIVLDHALTTQMDRLNQRVDSETINIKQPPVPLIGAKGDYDPLTKQGTDDTDAINAIIQYANENNVRRIKVPSGHYLISKPIILNGVTMEGVSAHVYNENDGSIFHAKTKDFVAIKQGSLKGGDLEFNISDIKVYDAQVGFEIVYAINSKYDRLLADNCAIGFKLGDPTAVGSMFCEFNNLYTQRCGVGVESRSKEYFNNNVFNNGYIQGDTHAFYLDVTGGYGAVNNVFNNVEFRSAKGRGLVLSSAINTTVNNAYFECGGNAVRLLNYCSVTLNDCVFGLFDKANANLDTNLVYAVGGSALKINGGNIFFNPQYENLTFFNSGNPLTHLNVLVIQEPRKTGSATGFKMFEPEHAKSVQYVGRKQEEQTKSTTTQTIPAGGFVDFTWTYDEPFSKIPEVIVPVIRGAAYQGNTLSWVLFEWTATGGKIRCYNNAASTDREIYFNIYAKTL